MNNELNLTETPYNKPLKDGELVNYRTFFVQQDKQKKHQVAIFDSIGDLITACETNRENGTWDDKGQTETRKDGTRGDFGDDEQKWTFGKEFPNLESTREALFYGMATEATVNKVNSTTVDIYEKHPELFELERRAYKTKRRRTYGEEGAELNIDRYMCGDPQMWEQMSRRPAKQSMKIMVNGTLNGGNSSDRFMSGMVLVAAFLDILDKAGISSEVWYAPCTKGTVTGADMCVTMCRIKSSNEPLDIQRLLSAGTAGLFRYYTFRALCNIFDGSVNQGLGRAVEDKNSLKWVKQHFEFDVALNAEENEQTAYTILMDSVKNLF